MLSLSRQIGEMRREHRYCTLACFGVGLDISQHLSTKVENIADIAETTTHFNDHASKVCGQAIDQNALDKQSHHLQVHKCLKALREICSCYSQHLSLPTRQISGWLLYESMTLQQSRTQSSFSLVCAASISALYFTTEFSSKTNSLTINLKSGSDVKELGGSPTVCSPCRRLLVFPTFLGKLIPGLAENYCSEQHEIAVLCYLSSGVLVSQRRIQVNDWGHSGLTIVPHTLRSGVPPSALIVHILSSSR